MGVQCTHQLRRVHRDVCSQLHRASRQGLPHLGSDPTDICEGVQVKRFVGFVASPPRNYCFTLQLLQAFGSRNHAGVCLHDAHGVPQ